MLLQSLSVQVAAKLGEARGMKFDSRILRRIIFAALCIGVPYFAYKLIYPDYTYRYRLELTLELDGKPYTDPLVVAAHQNGFWAAMHESHAVLIPPGLRPLFSKFGYISLPDRLAGK